MRVAVFTLLTSLVCSTAPAYGMSEWTWHKTPDGAHPDGHEQEQLWLINRARKNPAAEGAWLASSSEYDVRYARDYFRVDKNRLRAVFSAIAPSPPAAHDVRLYRAAKAHSLDQIARDVQDHVNQLERVDAQNFYWTQYRGNVFSYAQSALNSHAGFNIDWGHFGSPYGMQDPPGHRMAIMAIDGDYTNVGIATVAESDRRTKVGKQIVTQNFARAASTVVGHYNAFIVGTVWKDKNNNGRFDGGEGYEGVTVMPSNGDYYAVTAKGGGYAIPITEEGHVLVTFSGGGLPEKSKSVRLRSTSVLVDYKVKDVPTAVAIMQPGPAMSLTLQGSPSGPLGYGYGTNQHQSLLQVKFQNPGVDSVISLQGYDIDRFNEVMIYLNGQAIGWLNSGGNNTTSEINRIFVRTDKLQPNNILELRQRFLGERWGVQSIEMNPNPASAASLNEGSVDTNIYGTRSLNGANPAAYRTTFIGAGKDLLLRVHGYQIEGDREVEVMLNGERLGWMLPLRNKGTMRRSKFSIPARMQQLGTNELEFRAYDDEWGIQNLEMLDVTGPSVPLSVGVTNLIAYGWGAGSDQHRTLVRTTFPGTSKDLQLSATAVGDASESGIDVVLNGQPVSHVKFKQRTPTSSRLVLSRSLMNSGTNVLEFRRKEAVSSAWSVKNIELLDLEGPDLQLAPNVPNSGLYGWNFGSGLHRGLVRTRFVNTGADFVIKVAGYSVTKRNGITVWLNDEKIGRLDRTEKNELGRIQSFALPAHLMVGGINEVEFRQDVSGRTWGVGGLQLVSENSPVVPLTVGATDFNGYGWNYGGGQHNSVLRATFNSTGEGLDLTVVGFDIENRKEVEIYLNGKRVGQLKRTAKRRHGRERKVFLPAGAQVSGQNVLEFRRPKPEGKWGVTKLRLRPI